MILNNTASTTTTVHNMTNSGWGKKRIQRAPLPGHHSEYKKLWHLTGRKLRPCTNWIDWKPDKGRSQENVQKCYSIKMILLNHCLFISIVVYIHIHVKGSLFFEFLKLKTKCSRGMVLANTSLRNTPDLVRGLSSGVILIFWFLMNFDFLKVRETWN